MKYRTDYQLANDIDWFAEYNGIPLHVASNGCILPPIDSKINRNIQRKVAELIYTKRYNIGIQINVEIRQLFTEEEKYNDYIASFVIFAKLGFISCDTIRHNETGSGYRIVAYPSHHNDTINNKNRELYKQLQIPELSNTTFNPNFLTELWHES